MSVNRETVTEEITGAEIDAAASDPALANFQAGPALDLIMRLVPIHYGEKISAVITRSWPA